MSAKDFLKKLSEAAGVSGYEHAIREMVIAELKPYADEITITSMGSVIALKRGAGTGRVLIEGHMDEIGLMVTDIEQGFLRFTQVGGFDARVLPAQEVLVHGKQKLRGIIGARPPHILTEAERDKVLPMSELWIDVGLPDARVRELVQVGDLITYAREFVELKNDLVAGKSFDDRAAVVCVAEAFQALTTMKHTWDVYAVANVQEEVGLKGAQTAAFQINPDVAIAIDVSHADQPNTTEINAVPLGNGMGIALGPNIHPHVHAKLIEVAKKNEIQFKVTAYTGATGTDAWAMQVVRAGIPTGLIDIPLRYMHTSVETLCITDVERIGRLLALFCAALDDKFLRQLRGETEEAKPVTSARRRARAKRRTTKDQ